MDDVTQPNDAAKPATHPLQRIPIEITVSVGTAAPLVSDLLNLGENAILPLDRNVDDPVELFIGDKLIARGELQEFDGGEPGQLAVRLTEVAVQQDDLA